jgi:hypothetical protein
MVFGAINYQYVDVFLRVDYLPTIFQSYAIFFDGLSKLKKFDETNFIKLF